MTKFRNLSFIIGLENPKVMDIFSLQIFPSLNFIIRICVPPSSVPVSPANLPRLWVFVHLRTGLL